MILTAINDGDGQTATATIEDSQGGTIVVYAAQWDGLLGSAAEWEEVGTREDDGECELTFNAPGYYWLYALEDGELSNFFYVRVVSDTAPQIERIEQAVAAQIQALNLPGIGGNVIAQRWPDLEPFTKPSATLPVCLVSVLGAEQNVKTFNNADDISYPVVVFLVSKELRDQDTHAERNRAWRQSIIRAFINQSSIDVPGVFQCVLDTGQSQILNPTAWAKGFWHQQIGLRFISRDPRGFGA